jgi:threonine/homoserine/homoserine lactone efflux protein
MVAYLIFGAVVAFAAAVQPGPFQAYLISRALSVGWRRTLPAALSPLVSDGPVIVVVLLVLSRMPHAAIEGLRCAGGVLLLVLAVRALRTWRRFDNAVAASAAPSAGRSVLAGALVNILNPGPWLGWSLVLGPMLVKGWREAPSHGIALIAGFYATMVASLTAIIVAFGAARGLGPKVERALVGVSAAALALFGAWQLWSGAAALVGR